MNKENVKTINKKEIIKEKKEINIKKLINYLLLKIIHICSILLGNIIKIIYLDINIALI